MEQYTVHTLLYGINTMQSQMCPKSNRGLNLAGLHTGLLKLMPGWGRPKNWLHLIGCQLTGAGCGSPGTTPWVVTLLKEGIWLATWTSTAVLRQHCYIHWEKLWENFVFSPQIFIFSSIWANYSPILRKKIWTFRKKIKISHDFPSVV